MLRCTVISCAPPPREVLSDAEERRVAIAVRLGRSGAPEAGGASSWQAKSLPAAADLASEAEPRRLVEAQALTPRAAPRSRGPTLAKVAEHGITVGRGIGSGAACALALPPLLEAEVWVRQAVGNAEWAAAAEAAAAPGAATRCTQ